MSELVIIGILLLAWLVLYVWLRWGDGAIRFRGRVIYWALSDEWRFVSGQRRGFSYTLAGAIWAILPAALQLLLAMMLGLLLGLVAASLHMALLLDRVWS